MFCGPKFGMLKRPAPTPGPGHVLDADTIALWRMDEEDGIGDYINIFDTSGNGFNLTVTTGTINIIGGPATGLAKLFVDDIASHPYDAALTALFLGEWTMEGWWYPDANDRYVLWSYGSSGESEATNQLIGIVREVGGAVTLSMERGASGTDITINSTAILPDGEWTHLAVAKEDVGSGNFDYSFYINGVFVDTVTGLGPTGGGTQVLRLGAGGGGGTLFEGGVGTQRCSDIVRSSGEIAASYARAGGDHVVDGNTFLYYHMGEQPSLLDEANFVHLKLASGSDQAAEPLISGGGRSRAFLDSRYINASAWTPIRTAILAAIHDEMTVEWWARLAVDWDSAFQRGPWVFGTPGVETQADNFFSFDVLSSRVARVFSEHGSGVNAVWDTVAPVLSLEDQWSTHHYAVTLVASGGFNTYEFYLDGVLVETSDGTDIAHDGGTNNEWEIGKGSDDTGASWWLGHLDDMRLSNKKRSAEEILASYNSGVIVDD